MLPLFGFLIILISLKDLCFAETQVCKDSEMEKKLIPIIGMFGIMSEKFPENEQEMDQLCRSIPRRSNSAKNYTQTCMKGISKTLLTATIYSVNKVISKQYCNNKSERNKFISRAKCGNKGKKNTAKCWNQMISNLENTRNVSDNKMKIPLVCCYFFEWKTCTVDVYRDIGEPICPESAREGHEQHIDRGALDPLNILCSDYDESDKCDHIKQLLPKSESQGRQFKTFLPPVIHVFESL